MTRVPRLLTLPFATVLVVATVLSGCGGGAETDPEASSSASSSSPDASASETPTPTPSETPYLPVPNGVKLSEQGSELDVGDNAVVAYRPRQDQVGVLSIKVTRLRETTFEESFRGWKLNAETKKATPYFVYANVSNKGRTNLGGRGVPLYIVDGDDTLIEATTFASRFTPCPSTPFPKKFAAGDRIETCLVYLAPERGDLTAVSFRPTQEFDPITWTGKIDRPATPKQKQQNKQQG